MSKVDSAKVSASDAGLVHIAYTADRETPAGPLHEEKSMYVERASASKIAALLREVGGDEQHGGSEVAIGGDTVKVYWSGHEMSPYVNLSNERASGPRAGYQWFAMTPETARKLASALAGL